MNVNCFMDECQHFKSRKCKLSEITIDCDGCEDYTHYSECKEYQSEYWKTVRTVNKKVIGRTVAHGKLIQINGIDFFTEDDDRLPDNEIHVTNAKTGYMAGNVFYLKNNWQRLLEAVANTPDVMQYPICEFDSTKKGYVITEGATDGRC